MSFALSLVLILGFIVPGAWVLLAVSALSGDVHAFLCRLLDDPSLARGSFALGFAFALGALLDSARALAFDKALDVSRKFYFAARNWAIRRLSFKHFRPREMVPPLKPPSDYLTYVNEKSLPVFQMLIDRTQEYYRFNANSCLGIFCLIAARWSQGHFGRPGALLCALVGLFYLASFKSRNETLYAMQQFCKSGEQANVPRTPVSLSKDDTNPTGTRPS